MSHPVDAKSHPLLWSLGGMVRGGLVEAALHPLETVKIRLQSPNNAETTLQTIREIFKAGPREFYRGLYPQLIKTCSKSIWCWPVMTGTPSYLDCYGVKGAHQQILTGLLIATLDAVIATPLERAKILTILKQNSSFSWSGIYKEGWHGFSIYWAKRSVGTVTFLVAQQHLRDRARTESSEPLSLYQLTKIGTQVGVIVSLVLAPLDRANTLRQAQLQGNLSQILFKGGFLQSYRGCHLSLLSSIINTIASVVLLEVMSQALSNNSAVL